MSGSIALKTQWAMTNKPISFFKFAETYFMRQYFFLGVFVFLFVSCQRSEYTLNVSANVDDKQQLYLIALDENNQPQTLDTLYIEQGIASYEGSMEFPEMHYLLMQGNRDVVPVILEAGTIAVEIYKDSIRKSTVGGTKSNKEFKRYINESTPLVDDLFAIQNEMRNAMVSRDSLAFVDLKEQLDAMQSKFNDFQVDYVTNNSDSYISTLILEQLINAKGIDVEQAKSIYGQFSNTLKGTKAGKKIESLVDPKPVEDTKTEATKEGNIEVGDSAPDFTAPSVDGSPKRLYASLGQYTILDFWASWCGPCRVESPNMVKLYEKFKNKGLRIIGVSLDKDKKRWEKAIENDKLDWDHISNLKRWEDPIAATYGVRSIPQLFLLDKDGKVIAKERRAVDFIPLLTDLLP
ncbi:MAG: TlpA disulfide reductase family protein [Flavobacteriaceae bacterium]|nr:TlpA disulfide reductase family protein [Flavobacteriaceae bacterium]